MWHLLCKGDLDLFIEKWKGYDRRLADMIIQNWTQEGCKIHEIQVQFTNDNIDMATRILNWGKEVKHNSRISKGKDISKFQIGGIQLEPYKSGFFCSNLPYPWYKLCKFLMKYITLDGDILNFMGIILSFSTILVFLKNRSIW